MKLKYKSSPIEETTTEEKLQEKQKKRLEIIEEYLGYSLAGVPIPVPFRSKTTGRGSGVSLEVTDNHDLRLFNLFETWKKLAVNR